MRTRDLVDHLGRLRDRGTRFAWVKPTGRPDEFDGYTSGEARPGPEHVRLELAPSATDEDLKRELARLSDAPEAGPDLGALLSHPFTGGTP